MSTYVIVDVDYWGGRPVPKIIYAGQDFETAQAKFRELFDLIAVKNGKCINIPSQYWPYIGKDLAGKPFKSKTLKIPVRDLTVGQFLDFVSTQYEIANK